MNINEKLNNISLRLICIVVVLVVSGVVGVMYMLEAGAKAAPNRVVAEQVEPAYDARMVSGVLFQPHVLTEATLVTDELIGDPLIPPVAGSDVRIDTESAEEMRGAVNIGGDADPDAFFDKLSERLNQKATSSIATP